MIHTCICNVYICACAIYILVHTQIHRLHHCTVVSLCLPISDGAYLEQYMYIYMYNNYVHVYCIGGVPQLVNWTLTGFLG